MMGEVEEGRNRRKRDIRMRTAEESEVRRIETQESRLIGNPRKTKKRNRNGEKRRKKKGDERRGYDFRFEFGLEGGVLGRQGLLLGLELGRLRLKRVVLSNKVDIFICLI